MRDTKILAAEAIGTFILMMGGPGVAVLAAGTGTLDGAAVYPREVAIRALQYNAAAVIFAHNHPSGVAEPSSADRRITERLCAALALLDIRVLDHLIIARGRAFSFAEDGLL